jgi:hypothetical protein
VILNKFTKEGGRATGYGIDGRDQFPGVERECYLLHSVQTGSVAHPDFYPMRAGG